MRTWVVRVGTFNTWRESKGVAADLVKVGARCDLMLLNEAAGNLLEIREFAKANPDWRLLMSRSKHRAAAQNVILFRKSVFALERYHLRKMCDAIGTSPERWMLVARLLHHNSGHVWKVRCTHMNSHVENRAWWQLPRFGQYREHLRRLTHSMERSLSSEVNILAMDTNASWANPAVRLNPLFPYARLRLLAGARSSYDVLGRPEGKSGTHGKRLIDAIFLADNGHTKFVRQHVITDLASDHNALVTHLQVSK